jgi:redox-regulated HSP33 family molecular chaperone
MNVLLAMMKCVAVQYLLHHNRPVNAYKWSRLARVRFARFSSVPGSHEPVSPAEEPVDTVIAGMSGDQDVTVKIIQLRHIVREAFKYRHNTSSSLAVKTLGELMACSALLSMNLKDDEILQLNVIGDSGFKRAVVVTNHNLTIRAMLSNSEFDMPDVIQSSYGMQSTFGQGQIQVLKNHPSYKQPTQGVVVIREADVPLNMALYVQGSEQRNVVFLTDVMKKIYTYCLI